VQGLAEKTLHGLINRCQNFFDHLPAQVSDQTFQRKSATGKAATPDAHLCGVVVAIVSRPHRRWTICFHLHQDGEAEQCCQKLMRARQLGYGHQVEKVRWLASSGKASSNPTRLHVTKKRR
jgi:hypothetical protein